jgi:predicted small lipoprotein YifL
VFRRVFSTGILVLILSLAVAACGQGPKPAAEVATSRPTTAMQYQMAVVKTTTPTPDLARPTAVKPTATWVPLITPSPTPGEKVPSQRDVPRIGVAEAKAEVDAGEAIFVDVRTTPTYEQKHIAGALSMPAGEVSQRYAELPADKLIIFYCA